MNTEEMKKISEKIDFLDNYAKTVLEENGKYEFTSDKERKMFLKNFDEIKTWLKDNGYGMPKKKYVKITSDNKVVYQDGTIVDRTNGFNSKNEFTVCFGRTYTFKHVVYVKTLNRFFIWMERCGFVKRNENGEAKYSAHILFTDELRIVSNEDTFEYYYVKDDGLHVITPSYYEFFDNMGTAVAEKHNLFSPIVWLNNSRFEHFTAIETPQTYKKWKDDRSSCSEYIDCIRDDKIPNYQLQLLNDIEDYQEKTRKIHNALGGTVIAEKINDNLLVFRLICCNYGVINEVMRIYVDDKDMYSYKIDDRGCYKPYDLKNHTDVCGLFLLPTLDLNLLNGTRLECCKSFIDELSNKNLLFILVSAIIEPRIEQMCKIGFAKGFDNALYHTIDVNQFTNSIMADGTKKNIYQWLGINRCQATELLSMECQNEIFDILETVKKWIIADPNCRTIANIDMTTFKKYLRIVKDNLAGKCSSYPHLNIDRIDRIKNSIRNYVQMRNEEDGSFDMTDINNKIIQYIPKLHEMAEQCANSNENRLVARLYTDYIESILRCPPADWKLFPESATEIQRLHDDAATIVEIRKTEKLTYAFNENLKKIKDLAYDKNEEFVVVLPTKMDDFVKEGLALKHCVKSYIYHVAEGRTNIVMIRRKEDIDTPFFTVEVDNKRVIQQVHGFANCFTDTVPNLTEFVTEWAKEKNLMISNINKIR